MFKRGDVVAIITEYPNVTHVRRGEVTYTTPTGMRTDVVMTSLDGRSRDVSTRSFDKRHRNGNQRIEPFTDEHRATMERAALIGRLRARGALIDASCENGDIGRIAEASNEAIVNLIAAIDAVFPRGTP